MSNQMTWGPLPRAYDTKVLMFILPGLWRSRLNKQGGQGLFAGLSSWGRGAGQGKDAWQRISLWFRGFHSPELPG